jgi:hypothetical protein
LEKEGQGGFFEMRIIRKIPLDPPFSKGEGRVAEKIDSLGWERAGARG